MHTEKNAIHNDFMIIVLIFYFILFLYYETKYTCFRSNTADKIFKNKYYALLFLNINFNWILTGIQSKNTQ